MFKIGQWVWIKDTDDHGKIENTGFTPADELYVRLDDGELTGPWEPDELMAHADYPHNPGLLYDCQPCEIIMDQDDDVDLECPGHESLNGAHMGESIYCDGSCRR